MSSRAGCCHPKAFKRDRTKQRLWLAMLAIWPVMLATAATPSSTPEPIINGQPADITEVPWQVALVNAHIADDFDAQFCGGSIISDRWILTAAHCLIGKNAADVDVLAGVTTLGQAGSNRISVQQIVNHPSFNAATFENDIALLRLSTPLTLSNANTQMIALPYDQEASTWPAASTSAVVSGWGNTTTAGSSYPTDLMAAVVAVLADPDDPSCGSYPGTEFYPALMLCAAELILGKDSCQGDSGGPLAVEVGDSWTLAGIVSWGYNCADPAYPGVYTRITQYLSWIEDHVPDANPSAVVYIEIPTTPLWSLMLGVLAILWSATLLSPSGPSGAVGIKRLDPHSPHSLFR